MAVIIIVTIIIYVVLTVSSSGGPMSSRLTQILATNRFVQIMKADFPIIWGRFPTNKKSVFINKEIIGDRPVISRKRQSSGKLWSSTFWKRKNSSHLTFAGSLKTSSFENKKWSGQIAQSLWIWWGVNILRYFAALKHFFYRGKILELTSWRVSVGLEYDQVVFV